MMGGRVSPDHPHVVGQGPGGTAGGLQDRCMGRGVGVEAGHSGPGMASLACRQ